MVCIKCNETLAHKEDTLECCDCKNNVHFYCVGITESYYAKMYRNSKMRFTCQACLTPLPKSDKTNSNKL